MNTLKILNILGLAISLQACDSTAVSPDIDSNVIIPATDYALKANLNYNGACNQTQVFPIASATATSYRGNKAPSRAIDNNLATWSRWTSNGRGESITLDLGQVQVVDSLNTAWHRADIRAAYFDVQTSTNGSRRTSVLTGGEAYGTTDFISVADSDQAYFKFGNYLQAQDASSRENVDESEDWADFYSDANITRSVITFTDVLYTN